MSGSTKIVMGNVAFYKSRIKELEAEVKRLEKIIERQEIDEAGRDWKRRYGYPD